MKTDDDWALKYLLHSQRKFKYDSGTIANVFNREDNIAGTTIYYGAHSTSICRSSGTLHTKLLKVP